jgi:hypothetical protein
VRASAGWAGWLLLLGCSRAADPPAAASAPGTPTVPVVRSLGPSSFGGPETCFNATDDNGNLLLDEGCDVRQGDVHFMIAWPEAAIDVDLLVTDPSGSLAGPTVPSTLGLVLSDDCPRAGAACNGQAFESVHLDGDDVPPGTYRVRVVVSDQGPLERPLLVRFGARLPGAGVAREMEFSRSAREFSMDFTVDDKAIVGSKSE